MKIVESKEQCLKIIIYKLHKKGKEKHLMAYYADSFPGFLRATLSMIAFSEFFFYHEIYLLQDVM